MRTCVRCASDRGILHEHVHKAMETSLLTSAVCVVCTVPLRFRNCLYFLLYVCIVVLCVMTLFTHVQEFRMNIARGFRTQIGENISSKYF